MKNKINFRIFERRLGEVYVLLIREHVVVASKLNIPEEFRHNIINVSKYPDIQELMIASDTLVTDYSSVMFDYGVLKKPQIFFAYDLDKYGQDLRGFYLDYHKDLPGPIYQDPYELANDLKNLDQIAEDYKPQIDAFYDKFCSLEQGKGSKIISDVIKY